MDEDTLVIHLPMRRYHPWCSVDGCFNPIEYAVTLTDTQFGHVHACRRHIPAILLWLHVTRVQPLQPYANTWCVDCEIRVQDIRNQAWP